MQDNAKWRESQRHSNIHRMKKEDEEEEQQQKAAANVKGSDFVRYRHGFQSNPIIHKPTMFSHFYIFSKKALPLTER